MFVGEWIRQNVQRLPASSDVSVETWLKESNYTNVRRAQLLKVHTGIPPKRLSDCKCFVKDEGYKTIKFARGIYSRNDYYKTLVGPTFKLIEKQFFNRDNFIKKIPFNERAKYIKDYLGGKITQNHKIFGTDYTAFESHFAERVFQDVEFQLYDYCTQDLPNHEEFMQLLKIISGHSKAIFKYVTFDIDATRMSGEMCTSLGNGFTNLMLFLFTQQKLGNSDYHALIEGDDAIGIYVGREPTAQDYERLGFTIKIETWESIGDASFCGQIFTEDTLECITDPIKIILNIGWTNIKYTNSSIKTRRELLVSKALSYLYQYPSCPIIAQLCDKIIKLYGRHYRLQVASMTQWEIAKWKKILQTEVIEMKEPTIQVRILMERHYGITIEEQYELERFFRDDWDVGVIHHPIIDTYLNQDQCEYDHAHVGPARTGMNFVGAHMPIYNNEKKQKDFTQENNGSTRGKKESSEETTNKKVFEQPISEASLHFCRIDGGRRIRKHDSTWNWWHNRWRTWWYGGEAGLPHHRTWRLRCETECLSPSGASSFVWRVIYSDPP